LPNFGYHAYPLCSLKNSDSIFEFYNPENPTINVNIVTISRTKLKSVHFCFCVCKFGCYVNSLCSHKIFVSIFEFADRKNPTIHASIVSISCTELKYVQFLFIFGLIFVAMATPLATLKIHVVYLISPTLHTLPYMRKIPSFFAQNRNLCYFGLFLYKCGCHGNFLGSLEISDSIFEFADPENLTIRVRKYWIFCAELKLVPFFSFFAQIWLPCQLP